MEACDARACSSPNAGERARRPGWVVALKLLGIRSGGWRLHGSDCHQGSLWQGRPRQTLAATRSSFETLTGECTKVMLMDVLTDPAVCSDQVCAIRSRQRNIGYAFTVDSQGNPKPWIISFSGRQTEARKLVMVGNSLFTYTRFISPSMVRHTLSLASVRACSPMPMENTPIAPTCSASTIKGSFAGEFVIRHIGSDTSPN